MEGTHKGKQCTEPRGRELNADVLSAIISKNAFETILPGFSGCRGLHPYP